MWKTKKLISSIKITPFNIDRTLFIGSIESISLGAAFAVSGLNWWGVILAGDFAVSGRGDPPSFLGLSTICLILYCALRILILDDNLTVGLK